MTASPEDQLSGQGEPPGENWGHRLVRNFLHPFVVFGAPCFITLLLIYLLVVAFRHNLTSGLRSFAAILLPLVLSSFVLVFRKELLEKLGRIKVYWGFIGAGAVGFGLLVLVRGMADLPTPIPVPELVLSTCLSVLVFGYASLPANRILSLFYGTVVGFLIHVVLLGWPL